jgi:aminopeptidase
MIKIDQKMRDYAKVIVRVGVNVQPQQIVIIDAIVEAIDLVNLVVEECYKVGASHVRVNYDDIAIKKFQYQYESLEQLKKFPDYLVKYRSDDVLKNKACRIAIRGSDPNGLQGIDPKKIMQVQRVVSSKLKPLSD